MHNWGLATLSFARAVRKAEDTALPKSSLVMGACDLVGTWCQNVREVGAVLHKSKAPGRFLAALLKSVIEHIGDSMHYQTWSRSRLTMCPAFTCIPPPWKDSAKTIEIADEDRPADSLVVHPF